MMKRLFGVLVSLFALSSLAQDQKAKNAAKQLMENDAIIKDRSDNVYIKVDNDDPSTEEAQNVLRNSGRTTRSTNGMVQINPTFLEELKSDPSFKEELNNADCCTVCEGIIDNK
jgi:hypothetical protein